MDLLTQLDRAGTTMLVVTHNPEAAASVPRVLRMRDGPLTEVEPTCSAVPGQTPSPFAGTIPGPQ